MRRLFVCLLIPVLLLAVGCANREITSAPNPYEIDVTEYDRIFEAAHHVLRDYQFTVERSDYRFGVVLTEPRGAATIFEPWRPGNTTLQQALFATGNDLRRIVRVTLEPWEDADTPMPPAAVTEASTVVTPSPTLYGLRVEVMIEKRQMPSQYITRSSTSQVLRTLDEVPHELAQRNIPAIYWQPVGRDALLENRLMAEIVRKSTQLTDLDDFDFIQP